MIEGWEKKVSVNVLNSRALVGGLFRGAGRRLRREPGIDHSLVLPACPASFRQQPAQLLQYDIKNGDVMTIWQPFEEGHTVGRSGAEGGVIVLDDEHPGGARITVERDCLRAPFAITCGVYGWLVHTRFVADEETAQHAVAAMKPALAAIVALIPAEDAPDEAERLEAAAAAAADFAEQFV